MIAILKDYAQIAAICATISFGLTLGAGLAWAVLRVVWGWMLIKELI